MQATPVDMANSGLPTVLDRLDPWMLVVIVLAVLLSLMASLWMVYSYINNIRTTDIHRRLLYDAVKEARYRELKEQAVVMVVTDENDPELIEERRQDAITDRDDISDGLESLRKAQPSEETSAQIEELERDLRKIGRMLEAELSEGRIKSLREEQVRRANERGQQDAAMRESAARDAESLVPASLTIAGMGITGSFFIELTAILTIIFGIIILGLVGVLGTQQIAPILAAIAGYVLGKTSNNSSQIPTAPSPQPLSSVTSMSNPTPNPGPQPDSTAGAAPRG